MREAARFRLWFRVHITYDSGLSMQAGDEGGSERESREETTSRPVKRRRGSLAATVR